jgi:hypothetical protein
VKNPDFLCDTFGHNGHFASIRLILVGKFFAVRTFECVRMSIGKHKYTNKFPPSSHFPQLALWPTLCWQKPGKSEAEIPSRVDWTAPLNECHGMASPFGFVFPSSSFHSFHSFWGSFSHSLIGSFHSTYSLFSLHFASLLPGV